MFFHITWLILDGKNAMKYGVFLFGYRPQRVCAAAKHLSFLYFSRQYAENRFQLKSTILCDIANIVQF